MSDQIEREVVLEADPVEVWGAVLGDGWLADEVLIDLRVGGDAVFRLPESERRGWVEEVREFERLVFWWAADGETATRVALTLERLDDGATRLRVLETRPLDVLDLVGLPLQRAAEMPISRQAVLKHLTALADAGLLDRTRAGREVRYRLTPEPLSDAVSWMADVGGQWDNRLGALRRQLER